MYLAKFIGISAIDRRRSLSKPVDFRSRLTITCHGKYYAGNYCWSKHGGIVLHAGIVGSWQKLRLSHQTLRHRDDADCGAAIPVPAGLLYPMDGADVAASASPCVSLGA